MEEVGQIPESENPGSAISAEIPTHNAEGSAKVLTPGTPGEDSPVQSALIQSGTSFKDTGIRDTAATDSEPSDSLPINSISNSGTPLVTARGTEDGLILRLDGRASSNDLKSALDEFVNERRGFLRDTDISLEWVGVEPAAAFLDELTGSLKERFNVRVQGSRLFQRFRSVDGRTENRADGRGGAPKNSRGEGKLPRGASKGGTSRLSDSIERETHSLFDGIDSVELSPAELSGELNRGNSGSSSQKGSTASKSMRPAELWDDADSRLICGTLRSGQRLESEHTVVICGDVNSGAEIVAGGDIIVLGTLRGVAHAGAYDETGGGRFIFALDLRPTQLRIGTVINRGASDGGVRGTAEIARVDADSILVEKYQSRQIALSRGASA